MIAECSAYATVRQHHSHLFECLGGWQHVASRQLSSAEVRQFMSQEQHLVAGFMYECSQRRWQHPPPELVAEPAGVVASEEEEIIEAAQAGAADMFPDELLDDL
jgi:hypothetical protein